MTSIQQVQQVAKKLETMLETALTQLKSEQKKRKENENRLMELELDLVNKEHEVKTLDNKLEEVTREKDEKISNLESSINYLQSVIIEKEQEILRLQEMLEEQGENASIYCYLLVLLITNKYLFFRNENIKHNPNLLCNICGKEFERHRRWCLDQHYLVHLSSKGRFLNLKKNKKGQKVSG